MTLNSEIQIGFCYKDSQNPMSHTLHISIHFISLISILHFIIALERVSEESEIVVSENPLFICECEYIYVWKGETEQYLKPPGSKNRVTRFRLL